MSASLPVRPRSDGSSAAVSKTISARRRRKSEGRPPKDILEKLKKLNCDATLRHTKRNRENQLEKRPLMLTRKSLKKEDREKVLSLNRTAIESHAERLREGRKREAEERALLHPEEGKKKELDDLAATLGIESPTKAGLVGSPDRGFILVQKGSCYPNGAVCSREHQPTEKSKRTKAEIEAGCDEIQPRSREGVVENQESHDDADCRPAPSDELLH